MQQAREPIPPPISIAVPLFLLFTALVQRHLVRGLTFGAVKG